MTLLTLKIDDTIFAEVLHTLQRFGKNQVQIIEKVEEKPSYQFKKLNKLKSHPNSVNGNSDDLVDIHWESGMKVDFWPTDLSWYAYCCLAVWK